MAGRAADVGFVLGQLTGAHPAWPGGELIDPSRMAMAGHSIGGAAAIATMLADSRIRAGIDMDGATHALIPGHGLSRPFLFLGKQSNYTPGSPGAVMTSQRRRKPGAVTTWEHDWELMTGWKRWLVVAGAVHASFTDLALLADQIGIDIDSRSLRSPVPGHHPRLRPGLLRPPPAWRPANHAGPAVAALPRGHVLFPAGSKPRVAGGRAAAGSIRYPGAS